MLYFLLAASLALPDIIFVSVDTLRADHLGCYGYSHNTSPNIDRLAKKSILFEDCVCETPLTSPSMGSMLTSRFPRTTGTTRNGLKMPDNVPTVTELLKDAGYETFCVQSNWTLKGRLSGLNRGFDVYKDGFYKKRWGVLKAERDADRVSDLALELLEKRNPEKPLFFWIHFSDPHAPYKFHKKFDPAGNPRFKKGKKLKTSIKYDSEIAFTDYHIARILEQLPSENAFVIFVADHGESLYEHDYLGHGRRIYQTGLHIPLMISGPGIQPARSALPVRGIDVGPTLLGMAGISPVPGMLGKDLLNEKIEPTRTRVIETYGGAVPKLPGAKALMAKKPPQWQGVFIEGWKLIMNNESNELFYLPNDCTEEKNIAAENTDRVTQMQTLVENWSTKFSRGKSAEVELSDDDKRALEALGYME